MLPMCRNLAAYFLIIFFFYERSVIHLQCVSVTIRHEIFKRHGNSRRLSLRKRAFCVKFHLTCGITRENLSNSVSRERKNRDKVYAQATYLSHHSIEMKKKFLIEYLLQIFADNRSKKFLCLLFYICIFYIITIRFRILLFLYDPFIRFLFKLHLRSDLFLHLILIYAQFCSYLCRVYFLEISHPRIVEKTT